MKGVDTAAKANTGRPRGIRSTTLAAAWSCRSGTAQAWTTTVTTAEQTSDWARRYRNVLQFLESNDLGSQHVNVV